MNEKEPIIVIENKPDKVKIEQTESFNVNLTLGLDEMGDYYLQIDFKDLNEIQFKKLVELSKFNRRLELDSEIIKKENYNITHIVVTEFSANNSLNMKWKCLSDDPSLYEGLNG